MHCFMSSHLGIFLRSALGFGANQISNSFSTPSKKLGLMLFNKLFSAIKFSSHSDGIALRFFNLIQPVTIQ